MHKWKVAVVGATGLVGTTILERLEERNFPVEKLVPMASARSAGKTVSFRGEEVEVVAVSLEAFDDVEIAFFAAGGAISREFARAAAEKGVVVVDNSSEFRMDPDVPLVVPEVNADAIGDAMLIANPNCSTIQCMLPLAALKPWGLERVSFATYQSVSGSGLKGLRDLEEGVTECYPYSITGNVLPHIDSFLDNGYTKEEMKMMRETQKILDLPDLPTTATTVRVPVRFAHSVSLDVKLAQPFELESIRQALAAVPHLIVKDDPQNLEYPIAQDAEGTDDVYVGRIRRDLSAENGLHLWVVADNIRKGAATNAVQIAEAIAEARRA